MMNIQNEVQKIHSQYGMSEKANYKIQLLCEQYAKEYHDSEVKKLNGEIRESGKLECPNCNVSHIIAYNNSKTKAKCIHCGFIWTI